MTVRSHGLLIEQSSQKQHDYYALHTRKESTNTSTIQPEDQVLDFVMSLVHQTHHAIISDDPLLCQQVARIYRQLGEKPMQMQQLKTAIAQAGQPPKYDRADTASDVLEGSIDQAVGYNVAKGHDSSTADVFLGSVSMFSMNDSNSSIDRLRGSFSGSPDYFLETSSSFHPELCATNSPSEMMLVSAILPLPSHPRSQRYFLTFQEKAHRWQRVIIVATFDSLHGPSDILRISALETFGAKMMCLPKPVQSPIRKALKSVKVFGSVTKLFVHLNENENGQITVDITRVEIIEHMLERDMSNEDKILQKFKHLGCDQFKESQVFFRVRESCHRNKVWVEGRYCIERKIPLASGGLQGDNEFDEFVDEVVRFNTFRDCTSNGGIIQFLGVILDDTSKHLKGYLCEAPVVNNLRGFLGLANKLEKRIPWPVRELWIRQIVAAISNLHAKNIVLGALNLNRVAMRADGTVALNLSESAPRHLVMTPDRLPPELRNSTTLDKCSVPSSAAMTFEKDIFQLGYAMWLITEHRPGSWGYYCTRNACTSAPRYQCIAEHARPTELPHCSVDIPPYINDIIKKCRLPKPMDRPTARELAKLFPFTNAENHQSVLAELIKEYSTRSAEFCCFCNECGSLTTDDYYHCYICHSNDFDLCPTCIAEDIHCWIPQHQLVRGTVIMGETFDVD